jgi:hypothetical protein
VKYSSKKKNGFQTIRFLDSQPSKDDVSRPPAGLRRYDMNGIFQMQGGKNWFLPKYINANRFFWDSHWFDIWSNHFCPSMGPNGGSVATDSVMLESLREMFSLLSWSGAIPTQLNPLSHLSPECVLPPHMPSNVQWRPVTRTNGCGKEFDFCLENEEPRPCDVCKIEVHDTFTKYAF